MKRKTLDSLVSYVGLLLSAVLIGASALAYWGYSFANTQVTEQLSQQNITFPTGAALPVADKDGFTAEDAAAIKQWDGQQLTTGAQAADFANHYIAVHMKGAAMGTVGKAVTYGEASGLCRAETDPVKAAPLCELRQTLFMGDTLRGMLLNAYAFWEIGQIAFNAAIFAFIAGLLMLFLTVLGFRHARQVEADVVV